MQRPSYHQMQMTIEQIELRLREVPFNYRVRDVELLKRSLAQHKAQFVANNDQLGAKEVWCLEQTLIVQEKYIGAFRKLKKKEFYGAWCELEKVEVGLQFLKRHLGTRLSDYWLDFILAKTHQLQSLFPYKIFFSPEFVYESRECMICNQIVSLRRPCGHRIGEIYDGKMCSHLITAVGFKGLSLVTKPHQKYSVAFMGEAKDKKSRMSDDYDYDLVKKSVEALPTPFCDWWIRKTKRHVPHSNFRKGRGAQCPCGSGENYARCCLHKPDVLLGHWMFVVDERVPGHRFTEPRFRGTAWANIWLPFTQAFWNSQCERGNCVVTVGRKKRAKSSR